MITRFGVQNYKALKDVSVDLTPIHVLIGPNDSGKSSLLDSMASFCRSALTHNSVADEFIGAWNGRQLVWRESEDLRLKFTASLCDDVGELDYGFECFFVGKGRDVRFSDESIKVVDLPGNPINLPTRESSFTALGRLDELSGQLDRQSLAVARRVKQLISGAHIYRWNARLLSLPAAPIAGTPQFQMEPSGFGLALVLDDILGYDRSRFSELESRFRDVFPDVKSIKLVRESGFRAPQDAHRAFPMLQQAEGKGLHFEFGRSGRVLPAAQVSDGVLLVLAYLTVLYLPEPPRMILVEEPENGIHPKRLEDVLKILREIVGAQSRSQVVMTTHSPYVIDSFKPEEVSLCRRDVEGAVSVHRLSNSKTVREQLDIFSLGEIWTASGEDAILKSESSAVEGG